MPTNAALLVRSFLWTILLVVASILLPKHSFGTIQIDSVKTTASTCPNNGSIAVFASSNAAPLLYSIVAGPLIQPVQTGNTFNSLPAGTYTVKVSNTLLEMVILDVTIAGNYLLPEFNPVSVSPYCGGGNDGQITGNLTAGTGNGPYSWQLIAPSPITSLPQANDTFNNLIAGNYTVRVTDACGSFRTIVATVTDPVTAFYFQFVPYFEITGCDSGLVTLYLKFSDSKPHMPLTYQYETKNGRYIPPQGSAHIDSSQFPSYVMIQQMIPHITYGDTVITTIYNACGDSLTFNSIIDPYDFHPLYSFDSCGRLAHVNFNYINDPYIFYGLKAPVHFTLTDSVTSTLIDSATILGDSLHHYYNMITGIAIHPNVLTGHTYGLTVTDGCGKFFQKNYLIPSPAPPVIQHIDLLQPACIDSIVGLIRIQVTGFSNPEIVFLSGPASLGSTKPGFAYTDTYTYPDTVLVGFGGEYFFLNNLAAGTYQFKVIDDCGNALPASFKVDSSSLTSLGKAVRYQKGCLGQNKIFYTKWHGDTLNYLNQNGAASIKITNLTSNTVLIDQRYYGNLVSDSLLNVPSGTYEISFGFEQSGYGTYVNDRIHSCLTLKDTIFIESYQAPVITSSNSILCHNTIHIQVIPDSSKAVPPYQYEIIAGPQIFPVQNSNIFAVNTAGTYTARIYDICGNASTASITADTLSFPPIVPLQPGCNSIKLFLGSSPYYTYTWTNPGNQVYTGDTLLIDPVTEADTGTYHIARMVDINGCKDTFNTTYHLTFPLTYKLLKKICNGDSVYVGNQAYGNTGIFSDTLISSKGCDSIVVLDLTVLPLKKDSIVRNICAGQSISIGTHSYNQTGIYRDTLSTTTCDSIVILNLRIDPIKKDSIVRNICAGQSISFGAHSYSQTGIYRDTLSTATCDSIVILNLRIDPIKKDSIVRNICAGQSISIGAHTYSQTGIYRDTLFTTTCDSIVILNLRIDPIKKDSIVRNICARQSISIGAHTYNQTGIYRDTVSTATCDSIVILNLVVNPVPAISITATPQQVTAGGTVQLNTTAAAAYLWTSVASLNDPAIQNPLAIVSSSAWVYLLATSSPGNCTASDSVFVRVIPDTTKPCAGNTYIHMPNAFTPDGNTVNDVFKIHSNNIRITRFQVYNRWGEMVFETADISKGWDGTYRGKITPGNYVYLITYFECNRTTVSTLKGSIVLIR